VERITPDKRTDGFEKEVLMYIKPWSKDSERILRQLTKNGKAYTTDLKLTRAFGRRCPEIIDANFMDIGRIDKKKKSVFVLGENIVTVPKKGKFFFYRID